MAQNARAEVEAAANDQSPTRAGSKKPGPKAAGKGGGPQRGNNDGPAKVVVRPMAQPARRRKRHYGLALVFTIMVLIPVSVVAWYMHERAVDQYASTVGFTVRQEEGQASSAILGGLASFAGMSVGGGASDPDVLFEFIQSQTLVKSVDAELDLWSHYSAPYDQDPIFALKPGGTIEDLADYWTRIVAVNYDQSTGLIGLDVRAFDPEFAKRLADEILSQSQILVNDLNSQARDDILRSAEMEVEESLERLKNAREALVRFRTRTQIVDPVTDLETRMGVQTQLQSQLAQALVEYDVLIQTANENDPRVQQARRRIDVIRARLIEERAAFANQKVTSDEESYPTLIAEYERLAVEREYAERTYTGALAQLDSARVNATRQSRYLAAYILPIVPETAEYPKRLQVTLVALLFLMLGWGMFTLIYYSVRDRS